MIFQRCTHFEEFKTPPLLIALRGKRKLYQEALDIFYRLNYFRVKLQNLSDFKPMSKKAIETIQNLTIS